MSDNVVALADRATVMVITAAKFRRSQNPKLCNPKRYHVWRWRGGPKAPAGTLCQCGLLDDPPRHPTQWPPP